MTTVTRKSTARISLESALSDLLCDPKVRRAAHPDELRRATTALAESLGFSPELLDMETKRIAEKREGL